MSYLHIRTYHYVSDTQTLQFSFLASQTRAAINPKHSMGIQAFRSSEEFFVCRNCQSHIARESDLIHRVYQSGLFTSFCIFQNLESVEYCRLATENTVERVHCVYCTTALGFRYVQVPEALLCPIVQNGRSKLSLDRLSYWNGCQIQSGYAPILRELQPGPEPIFNLVPEPPLDAETQTVKPYGAAPPRVSETDQKPSGAAAPKVFCVTCGRSFGNKQALGSHRFYAHDKKKDPTKVKQKQQSRKR